MIQEFFHIKTEEFLNIIGKEIFLMNVKRQKIQLHLLGIINNATKEDGISQKL